VSVYAEIMFRILWKLYLCQIESCLKCLFLMLHRLLKQKRNAKILQKLTMRFASFCSPISCSKMFDANRFQIEANFPNAARRPWKRRSNPSGTSRSSTAVWPLMMSVPCPWNWCCGTSTGRPGPTTTFLDRWRRELVSRKRALFSRVMCVGALAQSGVLFTPWFEFTVAGLCIVQYLSLVVAAV